MCRRQHSVTSPLHKDHNRVITIQLIRPRLFSPEWMCLPLLRRLPLGILPCLCFSDLIKARSLKEGDYQCLHQQHLSVESVWSSLKTLGCNVPGASLTSQICDFGQLVQLPWLPIPIAINVSRMGPVSLISQVCREAKVR